MGEILNPFYLKKEMGPQLKNVFKSQKSIVLDNFLENEFLKGLISKLKSAKFHEDANKLTHSYHSSHDPVFNTLFSSEEFFNFIGKLIGLKLKTLGIEVRMFRWKNYTIINDHALEEKGIDVIIDLTRNWNDSFGGKLVYVE